MRIPEFIQRCERFEQAAGVSRTWLSKRLFADTRRLKNLADGKCDVGVRRLERAEADLAALEREHAGTRP